MNSRAGKIEIPKGVNVWPHEYQTAVSLSRAGHHVKFIRKSEIDGESTPDIIMDGQAWEIKAPTASSVRAVDRNVRKALKQSSRVIVDARRMKGLSDSVVQRELCKHAREMRSIKGLIMVDHNGAVIDIL